MKSGLAAKWNVKEAWDVVKKLWAGDDRMKTASLQRLTKQFENLAFRDGESVGDPTAKARRIGESPTRWVGCETPALVPGHEEQPPGGVLAAEEQIRAAGKDGIADLVDLPRTIGLVREYENPDVGIG